MVGYNDQSKAYKYFDYTTKKFIVSRDVYFLEIQLGIPDQTQSSSTNNDILKSFLNLNALSPTYPTSDPSTDQSNIFPTTSSPHIQPPSFSTTTNTLPSLLARSSNPSTQLANSTNLHPLLDIFDPLAPIRRFSWFR